MTAFLPKVGEAMVENTGQPRPSYRRWMQQVTEAVNTPATPPGPDPEPPTPPVSFVINGSGSVTADGSIAGGEFVIGLDNDKDEPGNTKYYGTDSAGNRGFVALSEGLEAGTGIALTDSGYTMLPSVATPDDLPLTGNAGEAVRVTDEAPGVYAWDGAAFTLDTAADGLAGIVLDATADLIGYDNATSGLAATDVQAAVDELAARTGQWQVVSKATNEARTSNTTLTDDSALQIALAAGTYRVRACLIFQVANGTMDIKLQPAFSGTASATFVHLQVNVSGGTLFDGTATAFSTATPNFAAAGAGFADYSIILIVTVAGTFSIKWAQNVSDAGACTMLGGSYLEVLPIA